MCVWPSAKAFVGIRTEYHVHLEGTGRPNLIAAVPGGTKMPAFLLRK
jgi:hypothetical protein